MINLKSVKTCLASLLAAGLAWAAPLAVSASEDDIWPDLQDVRQQVQESETAEPESETEAETEAKAVSIRAPWRQPLTAKELTDLFGKLPPYTNFGSFFINRLDNLPTMSYSENGGAIESSAGYWIIRPSWQTLKQTIARKLDTYQGDWSVYMKDLTSGQTIEINEHSMESASLIKLFIAGTIYEQIEQGKLEETGEITSALDAMITVSDNESSNVLVRTICDESGDFQSGLKKVNDFIARNGFTNTQQVNGIADPSLWVSDGRVNMTSAADCGRLLEMVYRGELVSHYMSFRFETLLNNQQINYKIPDGLPAGVRLAHKTGEVTDTENDAAIIYTPYGDYIFTILSNHLENTDAAVDHIHEITALVYDYFTTPPAVNIYRADDKYAVYIPMEDAAYTDLQWKNDDRLAEWMGEDIPSQEYAIVEYTEDAEEENAPKYVMVKVTETAE